MTGASRRKINRQGNIYEVASLALKNAKCVEDCETWRNHSNFRVRMLAFATSLKLPKRSELPAISLDNSHLSEFEALVERFKAEGKKDPIKSARASLAATAKKRAAATAHAQV